jgi:tetratricopeptide (TPR) repeat protein
MVDLFPIAEARGEKRANAIFFHGLGGDAHTTWQADKADETTFWPAWLTQDIHDLSVYSVGYEAPVSRWSGFAMHLTDRATNMLARLLVEPRLANGTFVLIGHSLGGLLIKQLLRTAQSEAQNDEKAASFLRRVDKVAFLATPHTGADLAVWGDRLRILVRPSAATASLVRNDPNLRDLNLWYRDWANRQNIANLILTETKSVSILGMIVKPDSSDPGLAGPRPLPMDYDHEWICKPLDRTSDIYVQVLAFIKLPAERPRDPVAEQLEKLAAGQKELAAQVAREKGVEVAPLLAVLVKLGEKGVPEEDIPKRLDAAADELSKLRVENDQLRRGPPALAAIAEEVQALIDKGEFDDTDRLLARGGEAARALRIDASRYEVAFLAQRARVDDLRLAYRAAAAKYAEAATLVAPFDTEQGWRFLFGQSVELYKQGDEFGDNTALAEAIDIYRQCLALAPRSERPLDWARTQVNLGSALFRLGGRESGTARLEEAVGVYREAMQELTCARVPLEWAMTKMNLGNALTALGERESGTARLDEAVAAYREALQEFTRARAARLGQNPDESRQCASYARQARERDGAAGGGGFRLSRSLAGIYPRARAASMGHDPDESRRRAHNSRRAGERDGAAGGGRRRLS